MSAEIEAAYRSHRHVIAICTQMLIEQDSTSRHASEQLMSTLQLDALRTDTHRGYERSLAAACMTIIRLLQQHVEMLEHIAGRCPDDADVETALFEYLQTWGRNVSGIPNVD